MNLFESIKSLCVSKDISVSRLEQELEFANGSIRKWGKTTPSGDRLAKVADYFHVSVDYLLGRETQITTLTERDEKDVAKTMAKMREQLMSEQTLLFDGEVMDEETIALLLQSIEQQERTVKMINKKYIPKKHR